MKKLISIFTLAFLVIQSEAQQDERARIILDNLSKKTRSYNSIRAEFTIGLENRKDNITEEFSGSILMKGEKYRLSAMGSETFFDGKTIWTYLEEISEVYISDPLENENSILSNPSKLFTIYQDDFKFRFIAEVNHDGKKLAEIDLYPKDLSQQFSRIKLFINLELLKIDSAVLFTKDGNTYVLNIKSFESNVAVSDSDFVFNPAYRQGIEIIDMRF